MVPSVKVGWPSSECVCCGYGCRSRLKSCVWVQRDEALAISSKVIYDTLEISSEKL